MSLVLGSIGLTTGAGFVGIHLVYDRVSWCFSRTDLKGIKNKNDCTVIGREIFGKQKCYGFDDTDWRSLTRRCWVKFKKADKKH